MDVGAADGAPAIERAGELLSAESLCDASPLKPGAKLLTTKCRPPLYGAQHLVEALHILVSRSAHRTDDRIGNCVLISCSGTLESLATAAGGGELRGVSGPANGRILDVQYLDKQFGMNF